MLESNVLKIKRMYVKGICTLAWLIGTNKIAAVYYRALIYLNSP